MLSPGDGPKQTRQPAALALAWLTWWFGFYSLTVLSFLLGKIRQDFSLSEFQLAWLTGIAIAASGLGGFLFGWLADRLGRRTSMALAIVTFSLGNLACGLAPGLPSLLAARALAGLGVGGSWGAGQALIGETFPPEKRGRYGALAQTGAPLGLGLATLVGTFLAPAVGWRGVFLASVFPLASLLLLARVPESPLWRQASRQQSIARELRSPEFAGRFLQSLILTALNMTNYWLAIAWLPRYLQEERGLSLARSGGASLAFVGGSLTGYLAFGWLSDRFGRRSVFTLFSLLMAGGLLMFTLFWSAIAPSPPLLFGFLFLSGFGTGTWSAYGPLFTEIFPTTVRGTAMSVIMNLTRGVQFLAPLLIAAVAPRWGMAGGIALAAGFALLAAAWVWTLPETRGKALST